MKLNWKLGIIAGIFMAAFMLYPQINFWQTRGKDWQGNYAYIDMDEAAYAAYIRALSDGRPRRNDPYTGRDHSPETPQPESLFSIQFAAPYLAAIPARVFGIPLPWTMILVAALAGFFAALALFWVIGRVTEDSWFAMAGSLSVLAGGALAAGEGAILEILEYHGEYGAYPYFPGFRRYIPAIAMPFFFVLVGAVWKFIGAEEIRKQILFGVLAVFSFAFIVFSYFYIWTTAAAWLGCLGILWLIARPEGFGKGIKALLMLGAGCLIALTPYAYLLSRRSQAMDEVQLLVHTRAPDLARFPEYISYAVLITLAVGLLFNVIEFKNRATLFALSLALVPIVVFNQQIITGRSLQPIHYQVFIGNYVAALAAVITLGIYWQKVSAWKPVVSKIALSLLTLAAAAWGFVECYYTVRVWDDVNLERDEMMPLARRLSELAKDEPDPHRSTILVFGVILGDELPSLAPQNILWSHHQHIFAGLSWQENKERYYRQFYYGSGDEETLRYNLANGDRTATISLFGWARHTDRLSSQAKPLTRGEVAEEARKYGEFSRHFSLKEASDPQISYVVVPNNEEIDLTNFDLWYERDAGERIGGYTLYRTKLKAQN